MALPRSYAGIWLRAEAEPPRVGIFYEADSWRTSEGIHQVARLFAARRLDSEARAIHVNRPGPACGKCARGRLRSMALPPSPLAIALTTSHNPREISEIFFDLPS